MAASNHPVPWTQSELEDRFLELVRAASLPEPRCNALVEGYVVDCWWPEQRVVAEIDGFAFHKGREAFERDRREDTRLRLANISVLRPTQRWIEREPQGLVSDLEQMLRGPAGGADR